MAKPLAKLAFTRRECFILAYLPGNVDISIVTFPSSCSVYSGIRYTQCQARSTNLLDNHPGV